MAEVSDALRGWFGQKFSASDVSISEFRRHAEGWSWQTYTMRVDWTDKDGSPRSAGFAVRREPDDGLLAPYDTDQQFRLHEAVLQHSDVPMPELHGLELDEVVLGRPFYVMERMDGMVPVQWRGDDPSVFPDQATRRDIGVDFVDVLSRIHSIDVDGAGLSFLGRPVDADDAASRQIDHWEQVYEAAALIEVPLIRLCLGWLRNNVATSGQVALVHGDYRIGNFMLDEDRRINAIFDWELAHLGDPAFDVAWAGLKLFRGRSDLFSHLLVRDEFIAEYESRTEIRVDPEVLRFWTVFGHLRASVPHISAARAFEDGRTNDLRLAAMGHQSLYILKQLVAELGIGPTPRAGVSASEAQGDASLASEELGRGAIQNSLPRILEGLAEQLAETVAPAVDDPFAKAQVMAAVELLNNLQTRVEWRTADFAGVVERVRQVLEEATDAPLHVRGVLGDPLPEPHDVKAMLVAERNHRRALGQLQAWLESQPGHEDLHATVQELVLWDLERELSLLRSGMYSASRKQRS
jgi:aminoglycoside phosphotransferase (APT) family kinase protein